MHSLLIEVACVPNLKFTLLFDRRKSCCELIIYIIVIHIFVRNRRKWLRLVDELHFPTPFFIVCASLEEIFDAHHMLDMCSERYFEAINYILVEPY